MNTEERGARIDQFMVGARWMMGILAALAIQDRADLHRTQGQIFEALKRIEGRK
jgi:hypothetical protein